MFFLSEPACLVFTVRYNTWSCADRQTNRP